MRGFGILFVIIGAGLGIVSARAISDPNSLIGWARWYDDPWAAGLMLGAVCIVTGAVVIFARRYLSASTERRTGRALWAFTAGLAGFLLFGPYTATIHCVAAARRPGCVEQDWSTVTGLTFSGPDNLWLAGLMGMFAALAAWLIIGLFQRRRQVARRATA